MLRILLVFLVLLGNESRSTYSAKPSSGSSSRGSSGSRSGYSAKPSSGSGSRSTYSTKPSSGSSKSSSGSGYSSKTSPSPPSKSTYSSKPSHGQEGKTFQNPRPKESNPGAGWDPSGTRAAQREESKRSWETTRARQVEAERNSAQKQQSRSFQNTWSSEKRQTRSAREREFYRDIRSPVSTHQYSDGYSSFFWTWLLLQSLDNRAEWAYHHRDTMDPKRYEELVANNAELKERINKLEAEKVARDPNYKPSEMKDSDLMYDEKHIQKQVEAEQQKYAIQYWFAGALGVWVLGLVVYGIWYSVFRYKF